MGHSAQILVEIFQNLNLAENPIGMNLYIKIWLFLRQVIVKKVHEDLYNDTGDV